MKYGAVRVRKMEPNELVRSRIEQLLATRKTIIREGSSSAGLNYTLLTALSIGMNYAYLGIPWSQAIDLTLEEARTIAADTFLMHEDEDEVVISLVTVKGTLKSQVREFYCVSFGWLWDLCGTKHSLHSQVETLTRR